MPPMLHVSFGELPRSGTENQLARNRRRGINKSQRILQLVSKAIRAARLIQSGPSPYAAAQGLIEQPAIQHEINRENRRLHLNRGEEIIPPLSRLFQRPFNPFRITVLRNQTPSVFDIIRLTEHINHCLFFTWAEFELRLQCCAWIEPWTRALGKRPPPQIRWSFHRAITPQEYCAITRV